MFTQHPGTATTTSARPNPSGVKKSHALRRVGDDPVHEVLAGDAEMRASTIELGHDLGGRDERHVDAGKTLDLAAIAPLVADLAQLDPALA